MKKAWKIVIAIAVVLALAAGGVFAVFAVKKNYAPVHRVTSVAEAKNINPYVMPIKLIAHRGYSGIAPENTLPAIAAAGLADFYGAEFDVRLSADGEWFVMHDDDVARMTDGEGLISEMTAEEIGKLTIDAGNNVIQYPEEKVPTAREMIASAVENGLRPVVEIKTEGADPEKYRELAEMILSLAGDDYSVISFSLDVLVQMRKYLPEGELWLLSSKVTTEQIRACVEAGIDGIDFNANHILNHRHIKQILDSGLLAAAWTVDNIRMVDRMYSKGVYFITTNFIQPA